MFYGIKVNTLFAIIFVLYVALISASSKMEKSKELSKVGSSQMITRQSLTSKSHAKHTNSKDQSASAQNDYWSNVFILLLQTIGPQESLKFWAQIGIMDPKTHHQKACYKEFYKAFENNAFNYSELRNAKVGVSARNPFPVKKLIVDVRIPSDYISQLLNMPVYSLKFLEEMLNTNSIDIFAESLKVNKYLITLNLAMNKIGSEGAKAMAEALKVNKTLTTLNLNINGINGNGIIAIAEALKVNQCLTILELGMNDIDDDDVKAIAEALKMNNNLTTLNLRANKIGYEGAKAIVEALKVNKTLTTLNLRSNNIGNEGAKAIAEVLAENKYLTVLDLSLNNISDSGAKALTEALRTTEITKKIFTLDLY